MLNVLNGLSVDGVVGVNLRRLRESAGLTQAALAAHMTTMGTDWTASNVSLVEAGKRKLTLTALADLCRVLNVKPRAFFGLISPDDGVAMGDTYSRLRALGGTDWSTTDAAPRVADDDEAAAVARQRHIDLTLWRIAGSLNWYYIPGYQRAEPDEQRALLRMVLETLYPDQGGDVIAIREMFARGLADVERFETSTDPGSEEWARFRTAATRKIIAQLRDYLQEG